MVSGIYLLNVKSLLYKHFTQDDKISPEGTIKPGMTLIEHISLLTIQLDETISCPNTHYTTSHKVVTSTVVSVSVRITLSYFNLYDGS